jgi:hypothetical protein
MYKRTKQPMQDMSLRPHGDGKRADVLPMTVCSKKGAKIHFSIMFLDTETD